MTLHTQQYLIVDFVRPPPPPFCNVEQYVKQGSDNKKSAIGFCINFAFGGGAETETGESIIKYCCLLFGPMDL